MSLAVGGFLVLHGLITSAIGFGGITKPDAPAMALPAWFSWWPGPFGRSWLIDSLQLGTPVAVLGGLLWLVAGVALIAGGLGLIGVPGLAPFWQVILVPGAVVSLVALALYFHPIYVLAIAINLAIVAMVGGQLVARANAT